MRDPIQLSAAQDLFYHGNLAAWQKLVNSFKLRVLISLSNKASDATLNVPAQFANIINNPAKYPIFAGVSDDFSFVYNPGASNTFSTYPFNPINFGSIANARAIATRCFCPPESLLGYSSFLNRRPTLSRFISAISVALVLSIFLTVIGPSKTFSKTDR